MKILLDENIDVRFKNYFKEAVHEVYTVRDMDWTGFQNGQLLHLIEVNNFDCWIVADKNIPHQQNLEKLPCLILVLNVFRNTLEQIVPLIPELLTILESSSENKVVLVPDATG